MDKYERYKQKGIKKLLRKARVPRNATYEQTNACILHYVRNKANDFTKICLPKVQQNDPDFLLKLYNANLKMVHIAHPCWGCGLVENVDFMIEFLKLADREKEEKRASMFTRSDKEKEADLAEVILEYIPDSILENYKLMDRMISEFSSINTLRVIRKLMERRVYYSDFNFEARWEEMEREFKKFVYALSVENLCTQARKWGSEVLSFLPKDMEGFNKLVEAGIEKDGFRSLENLDVDQILDNKELVIKAYERDGFMGLTNYINYGLSPSRTNAIPQYGKEMLEFEHDERYAKVQKALLADEQIKSIYEQEEKKQWVSTMNRNYVNPSLTNK